MNLNVHQLNRPARLTTHNFRWWPGRFGILALACSLALAGTVRAIDTPVTPGASPEVKSLLAYFSDIYGKRILSGQQEGRRGTNELGYELNYIRNTTGKLPALLSLDFSSCTEQAPHPDREPHAAESAIDWYNHRGGIVAFCWHWYAPLGEAAFYTKDTKFDISRGVTEGTPEYAALIRDLDVVAGELKLLRDAHVPVLWRPLHEVNGRWFWWGAHGPGPYQKLWRLMFKRFTYQDGLTNLLWVFSPGAETDLADWYPGDEYVDLIGQDHYPMDGNRDPAKDVFDELVALGRGHKLVGLSENGPIPDIDQVVRQKAGWLFFTTWSGRVLTQSNTKEQLRDVFNHPYVLNLDDLPDLKTYPFEAAGPAITLAFTAPPGEVAVEGFRRMPVVVAVQDRNGRTIRTGSHTVSIALRKNPSHGTLTGTRTGTTVNGVANFPDLKLDQPGEGYTFIATSPGLRRAISSPFQVGPGTGILREWWADARGEHSAAPENSPMQTRREILTKALEVPVQSVTNYEARLRGELLPPLSGSYVFWIDSLATSELWVGTNSTPASKVKIAAVTYQTPYTKWPHVNESESVPVHLEGGKRYYVEVLQHQKAGSAQLAVRWRLPNGVEERPIPGFRIALPDPDAASPNPHHSATEVP